MIRRNPMAIAILGFLVVASLGILLRSLTPIDETRYVSVAWEMHLTGDWLVPSKNFQAYSDKPPLLFWSINLIWLLTGVSEWAARIVGPLCGCVAIWLTALLARRLWPDDRDGAGRAALALAGLSVFILSGSLTMFDVPLTVATLIGLLFLHKVTARAQAGRFGLAPWAGYGAALALGVLAKGPVILFHLLPAAVLLPVWSRGVLPWRALPSRIGFALIVCLALIALWLIPAAIAGGAAYRNAILWHQSAGRMTASFAHARPWWFFLAMLPVLTFPLAWSPALWRAGWVAPWRADMGLRLCLVWLGGAFFLFSLTSGKQIHYLVPELPALALIAARLSKDSASVRFGPAITVLCILAAAALLAGIGLLPLGGMDGLVTPRIALIVWALLILALCWAASLNRQLSGAMQLSLGALLATNILIGTTGFSGSYSTHPMAAAILREAPEGLAYVGDTYNAEFNFAARLTQPVATPADKPALAAWIAAHPHGLVIGQQTNVAPPWAPKLMIRFRERDYALWRVADAPTSVRSSE